MAPPFCIADAAGRASLALDAIYSYGDNRDPKSFGWRASLSSVAHGLATLRHQIQTAGHANVEDVAAAIHTGWGYAVLAYWDPRGYCSARPAHTAVDDVTTVDSIEAAEASLAGKLPQKPRWQPCDFADAKGALLPRRGLPARRAWAGVVDDAARCQCARAVCARAWLQTVTPPSLHPTPPRSTGRAKFNARMKLQETPYSALSEAEKEKDRVIAEASWRRCPMLGWPRWPQPLPRARSRSPCAPVFPLLDSA